MLVKGGYDKPADKVDAGVLAALHALHLDGKNDRLEIKGADDALSKQLKVYNRWGELVFSSDNYQNDWDATYSGKSLPQDTYFYVFIADGMIFKGFVVIKR